MLTLLKSKWAAYKPIAVTSKLDFVAWLSTFETNIFPVGRRASRVGGQNVSTELPAVASTLGILMVAHKSCNAVVPQRRAQLVGGFRKIPDCLSGKPGIDSDHRSCIPDVCSQVAVESRRPDVKRKSSSRPSVVFLLFESHPPPRQAN